MSLVSGLGDSGSERRPSVIVEGAPKSVGVFTAWGLVLATSSSPARLAAMIAAVCIAYGCTVDTENTMDFPMPELRLHPLAA